MTDIKFCERCGVKISDVDSADWYAHMSIKYCPVCKKIVNREKTLARVHELRKRKKQKDKFRDTELEQLRERTELQEEMLELQKKLIIRLREEIGENIQTVDKQGG